MPRKFASVPERYITSRSPYHRADTSQKGYANYKFSYHILPPFSLSTGLKERLLSLSSYSFSCSLFISNR